MLSIVGMPLELSVPVGPVDVGEGGNGPVADEGWRVEPVPALFGGRALIDGVSPLRSPGAPRGPPPVVLSLSVSSRTEKSYHIKIQSKCLYLQDHWRTATPKCSLRVAKQHSFMSNYVLL